MARSHLSTHRLICAKGEKDYRDATIECLQAIRKTDAGLKLLNRINKTGFRVDIITTNKGNVCDADNAYDGQPLLLTAIDRKQAAVFQSELKISVERAVTRGITKEFIARQLANGLSPVTYTGVSNVVKPKMKWMPASPTKPTALETLTTGAAATVKARELLEQLMDGSLTVNQLPTGWEYDLARLLRDHLNPGPGSACVVKFNPTKPMHCVNDPAMHLRPPAIGLAHELVHALHAVEGVDLDIRQNGHNLAELITTGIPPYNYEPLSDNMMRTQWPTKLLLRENY